MFGEGPKNVYRLADILPHRFGPQDLLSDIDQPLLLQKQSHSLTYTAGRHRKLPSRCLRLLMLQGSQSKPETLPDGFKIRQLRTVATYSPCPDACFLESIPLLLSTQQLVSGPHMRLRFAC